MWFVMAALAAPQPGDVVFQETRSQQATWLKAVTESRYTHVGLVLEERGELVVVEAVQPVQVVPWKTWRARGVEGHVQIRRPERALTAEELKGLRDASFRHLGKPYDVAFAWDDDKLYCTELVAKAYEEALGWTVGVRRPIASWNIENPRIRAAMDARGMTPDTLALAPVDLLTDPRWRAIDPD